MSNRQPITPELRERGEQLARAFGEWCGDIGSETISPNDFMAWAMLKIAKLELEIEQLKRAGR